MPASGIEPFCFKKFKIEQDKCPMKVGTDGVLLGAWTDVSSVKTALDIGTGTGIIAIMLGQRTTDARIDAVEIERISFEQARENMANAPWADRLQVFNIAIQDYYKSCKISYDLIVSNPPFFSGGTFSSHQDRISVRHTVKLSHSDLLTSIRVLLAAGGRFCVILPLIEGLRFQELARSYQLFCTRVLEVRPKADKAVERLLLQFERQAKNVKKESLIIQKKESNEWTEDYIALTGDFYLKM